MDPLAFLYERHPWRAKRITTAWCRHGLVCWGHDTPPELTVALVNAAVACLEEDPVVAAS